MEDHDVEVLDDVSNLKRKAVLPSAMTEAKRLRIEDTFATKLCSDSNRPILININLGKPSDLLISSETQRLYIKHYNDVRSAVQRLNDNVLKLLSRKAVCESLISRAKYLITYPVNVKKPLATYTRTPGTPLLATNATPAVGADGLQIVSMIANKVERNLPLGGPIRRKDPEINTKVYAMKTDLLGIWSKGVIIEVKHGVDKIYRVRFDNSNKTLFKNLNAKQIAYIDPCDVRLPFGKRIIALYKPEDKAFRGTFMYAGIVAEPPKSTNQFRYLVFFDDGFAQYIDHSGIRLVYQESKYVWEDIYSENREFFKAYCEQFPERPMLKLQKDQVIKTEFNVGWWNAKVVDVDSSMVKMFFEQEKRFEWIYRGSTRLAPLYNELEKAKQNRLMGKIRRHNISTRKVNENQPYVEYTRTLDEVIHVDSDGSDSENKKNSAEKPVVRNVARKSTSQIKIPTPPDYHSASTRSEVRNDEGELCFMKFPHFKRVMFIPHNCCLACREKKDPATLKGDNPLRIPIHLGWERQYKKFRLRGSTSGINYRSPCGRTLRTVVEVNRYLVRVKSLLTIDFFSFDPQLCPFQIFQIKDDEQLWSTKDISGGKENVPIECVNCLTNEKPPYVEYATQRFPGQGVSLNLDKEFLCGCDCTDNCQNPLLCQCRQLTIRASSKDRSVTDVGYNYRRLSEPIVTGLYECNSRCKCGPSCMNRVVQNGLQIRLQMFKTARKGWGIRCVDDVAAGMFLCIYAGQLLTDKGADEDGNQYGDEYLADLDHIEISEQMKEGYESDVVAPSEDRKAASVDKDSDDDDDDSDDVSSVKSNSSVDTGDPSYSDPEYEPQLEGSRVSNYDTRSKNKTKTKRFRSIFTSEIKEETSSSSASESPTVIKRDLPDLDKLSLVLPAPLSPETEEAIENIELSRKPKKLEDIMEEKNCSKHTGCSLKKSQSLPVKSLSPYVPRERRNKFSIRSYFNEDYCYIMDAKSKGNIGRYLNHSCSPNSFVQNVFVDTHDLRFPTVAFFASERIKAGTELTWDYSYEVGSVVNKVLYCHCDSKNCRGRLL